MKTEPEFAFDPIHNRELLRMEWVVDNGLMYVYLKKHPHKAKRSGASKLSMQRKNWWAIPIVAGGKKLLVEPHWLEGLEYKVIGDVPSDDALIDALRR